LDTDPRKAFAKPNKNTTIEKVKVEGKMALTRKKAEERVSTKPEKALAKAKKAPKIAQAQIRREYQARTKAEKALPKAQLDSAKERQARAAGVSFFVRLTPDEHGQLIRVEIVEAQKPNPKRMGFDSLDGQDLVDLVAFMKEHIGTEIVSEPVPTLALSKSPTEAGALTPKLLTKPHKTPSAPSSHVKRATKTPTAPDTKRRSAKKKPRKHRGRRAETAASQDMMPVDQVGEPPATPRLPRPKASLVVSDIRVFRPGEPDLVALTFPSEEPFIVRAHFQLQGLEARSLSARKSTYDIRIYAEEITGATSKLITTRSAALVQDVLEYPASVQVPGLSPGLYRLVTVVTLGAPIMIGGFYGETIIEVI
jgi:hypothetical protein